MKTFRHGIHPAEHKDGTADLPTQRMPFVSRYVLPLGANLGAPSKPIVKAGQRVARGELVAEAGGFVSTCISSPVTGTVIGVGARRGPRGDLVPSIEIEADPFSPQRFASTGGIDWKSLTDDAFLREVQRAGLVGMGGAAFPSHVKYAVPEGRRIRRLVINGCECEPYLTCDHRVMVERADAVVRGIEILATRLGVEETVIGVEANKPDAVLALRKAAEGRIPLTVTPLEVKYPQGAEKMLIKALFGEEVPAGKLPLDLDTLVNNVGTMAAMADWFDHGMPLIERVLTVSGAGVARGANLVVPIGTPVRDVLEACGGLLPETREIVMGGPMMGTPLPSLDVPVHKGTSGILAFTESEAEREQELACLKCGRCLDACSNLLNPSRLARLARAGRWEEMEEVHAMDCMECGACSWACPSNIPIVQLIRVSKSEIRKKAAAKKAAADGKEKA
ncbi:electron transport complex subunit RsxC [bacterium]|nr:electron transport complex subunit RsxC [bacterium]